MNLASLNLTTDQNAKLTAWQKECMKDGSYEEGRAAFHEKGQGHPFADQYAQPEI